METALIRAGNVNKSQVLVGEGEGEGERAHRSILREEDVEPAVALAKATADMRAENNAVIGPRQGVETQCSGAFKHFYSKTKIIQLLSLACAFAKRPGPEKDVESVARNLVTLIQQSLGGSSEGRRASAPTAATDFNPSPRAAPLFSPPSRPATTSVSSEMQRSFPGLFRGKRRFATPSRTITCKLQCFQFYVLPCPATVTPKGDEELRFCQAGLGMRMVSLPEDAAHDQISEVLYHEYPKLQNLKGSWMFYKAAGGSGRRRLTVVTPQDQDSNSDVEYVSVNNLSADDTDVVTATTSTSSSDMNTCSTAASSSMASCPICSQLYPMHSLEMHASFCGESISDVNGNTVAPFPQRTATSTSGDWKTVADPKRAVWLFTQEVLTNKNGSEENHFSVDLRKDQEEQDRSYVSFYKRRNVEWASPLTCTLEGDAAVGLGVNRHVMSTMMLKMRTGFQLQLGNGGVTKIFEGQSDHLVPANSAVMVESELFLMAGRMMGHCFLYGGPGFPGLSPAITHVLCGGSIDTATVTIEDCPDLDIRETIQLVLGRSAKQMKQLRKGLKETGIWPLLSNRADVVKLLFPSEKEAEITPQMIIAYITWPKLNPESDDDDDEDVSVEAVTRVMAYFRTFIENDHLKNLLRFWVGWEVPPKELIVKVASGLLPRALTCFETIKLPHHYTTYKDFESDLVAAVSTCNTGFGLV
ncbi:hypothetical protein N1851_030131 [Merluccius polli]|uniref:HECT domain-containing protein n=1 Tax=Merluccius polli TaxID=89951 RepID=A0AA47M663_MERPO|nr:hypothetical protein N1851_030131 [Merluccius polli]